MDQKASGKIETKKTRKPYSKPTIESVNLVAEREVFGNNCFTSQNADQSGGACQGSTPCY